MEQIYPNCAGLDVHKKFVVVCRLSVDEHGQEHKEMRQYETMTADLEALADWLAEGKVTHVAMESTGVYWQPIYNLLEGRFELYLVNPQTIKRMPGRKTDMKDAEWIATLMQHGLLQRSFIPSREQRELRDLVRYRLNLVQERNRFTNRLQKVLETTNIKLASVVSDMQGVSAQAILRELLAGKADVKALAELARGQLRKKQAQLERALVGHMSASQRFLLTNLLTQMDFLDEQIAAVDEHIEALLEQQPPFQEAVRLLDTIPGVSREMAILIVAEIGVEMERFPSDRHLTAWAGVAPGNYETGGKSHSGKARQGNKYLQRALVLAAHAAARTKHHYLRSLYYRLAARRGKARAAVAVGRTILQAAYHMLIRGEEYHDLGEHYLDQLDRSHTAKRLVKRLQVMGFVVTLTEPNPAFGESSQISPGSLLPLAT
jgi:transposase